MIVDIDTREQCATRFCELDVVRWQLCQIDVLGGLRHPDEVSDAFQKWLTETLIDADHRLLVVRVELVGRTELNHVFRRSHQQLKSSLQAIAVTYGHQQVWLEELKIRSAEPLDHPFLVDLDGPLESLAVVISELKQDADLAVVMEGELQSLSKKLPSEISGADPVLPLDDPAWVGELLESAASEVLGRLQQKEAVQ